jgi:protein-L-isoaspartate(D-aspartate) O-methyltransferase
MEASELDIIRRAYAKQIMAAAGVADARVATAFSAVKREDFLGPGPWPVPRWRSPAQPYVMTPDADPVYLYVDSVIGILPERRLNNGQPSGHAIWIAGAAPQPGEHVVHIGAGTGYYTAILAELVGSSGRVTAIECDAGLAARAAANSGRPRMSALSRATAPKSRSSRQTSSMSMREQRALPLLGSTGSGKAAGSFCR